MSQFFKTYEETENWLDQMEIENYTIKDDLSVDVYGNVFLNDKNLTYIPVQFGRVGGYFSCSGNQLTSLEGSPSEVGGAFDCSSNQLTSLEGVPKLVGRSCSCEYNYIVTLKHLKDLKLNNLYCSYNYLTTHEYYKIDQGNPGSNYLNSLGIKVYNFLDKLETSKLDLTTKLRILRSLETYKPEVYTELVKLVDLDNWLIRLQNAETHSDIINL